MSNRMSICWNCIHREDCEIFEKNPNSTIIGCGRSLIPDKLLGEPSKPFKPQKERNKR